MEILRRKKTYRTTRFILLLVLSLGTSVNPGSAADLKLDEQKIQAGLIYNFLKYTAWPPGALRPQKEGGDSLQVCLLGGDPFAGHLSPIEGRTAQQYVIHIRRLSGIEETSGCNLVFVHSSQEDNVPRILQALRAGHILTVSNIDRFTDLGGMVEFSRGKDRRVHLYINRTALDTAGLTVSGRLLNLAELGRNDEVP